MGSFDLEILIKKKINFLIQKVFKLILLYQLQVKTDVFLQQSFLRYQLMRVGFVCTKILPNFCCTLSKLKSEMPYLKYRIIKSEKCLKKISFGPLKENDGLSN